MSNDLFKKVTESTGLPVELVAQELEKILKAKGISASEVTLEDLRESLSGYLKEVIVQAKDAFDQGILIEEEVSPDEFGK